MIDARDRRAVNYQLQEQDDSLFFLDPEGIQRWLRKLSLVQRGKSLRKIYRVLWNINQRKIPWRDRLLFVTELEPIVIQLLEAPKKHYMFKPFPLAENDRKMADLYIQIHLFLAISYKRVLIDQAGLAWLEKHKNRGYALMALAATLRHLEEIVVTCRLLCRNFPPDIWRQIHSLYLYSVKKGWLDKVVQVPGTGISRSNLVGYKRVLLMGMLDMHLLGNEQFAILIEHLDVFAKACKLTPDVLRNVSSERYIVILSEDIPPMPFRRYLDGGDDAIRTGSDYCLLLDTDPIGNIGAKLEWNGRHSLSKETWQVIHDCWSHPHVRQQKRFLSSKKLDVVFGFSAIHQYLNTLIASDYKEQLAEDSDDIEELEIGVRGSFSVRRSYASEQVKTPLHVENVTEMGGQEHAMAWQKVSQDPQPMQCQVLDTSISGYRLAVPLRNDVYGLFAGCLVALRMENGCDWSIGSVRWLSTDTPDMLTMGIQVHFMNVYPLIFRVLQGGSQSDPQPGFLAYYDRVNPVLVCQFLPGMTDKDIVLLCNGRKVQTRLDGEKYLHSPGFAAFGFSAGQVTKETHFQAGDLDELVQAVLNSSNEMVAADQTKCDWESKFSNLFDQ